MPIRRDYCYNKSVGYNNRSSVVFAVFRPLSDANKYAFEQTSSRSWLARHHINQSKIQIKKPIKSISRPSEVFYLCPDRVPSFFMGQISALIDDRKCLKKSATELHSHDATLPVVTSAPFFHLSPLLGGSCHIRRRIVAPSHPQVPLFFPFQQLAGWQAHTKERAPGAQRGAPLEEKQFGN